MKKTVAFILSFCIIAFAANACLAGNFSKRSSVNDLKYKNAITAARETMWKAITNGQGSGASVAVMDRGEIVYSEGIGVAERAKNAPVDRYTRFNIGSTSKMFVTAAVMLLVDEGKICLDAPLIDYIPEFTMKDPRYKEITVRMLFNHSSGLPGTTTATGYEADQDTHKTLLDVMRYSYLKHKPGAMSMYCNDGFTFAEILVEKASGIKFMDFIKKRIFEPLEMHNSGKSVGELRDENIAAYYDAQTGKKHPHEVLMVYGAGGISSTAEDLCRFGNSFCKAGKHILSERSIAEMRKVQPTDFSDKLRGPQMMQELGWEYVDLATYRAQGVKVMAKGGNTTYHSSNLQIVPDEGIVIGVIISGHASGEALSRPILDGVVKDRKIATPKVNEVKKPLEAQKVPDDLLCYEGYYVDNSKIVTLKFNEEKNGFDLYAAQTVSDAAAKDGKKLAPAEPLFTLIYNGGFFYNFDKNIKCYMTETGGVKYLISHDVADYEVDSILFQKLEPVNNPPAMKADMNKKVWLFRNLKPYIVSGGILPMVSNYIAGLPGYVDLFGIKKIETPDFASIAATSFRDQAALYLFENEGETWASISLYLLSPESCAKKIIPGVNRVFIGAKNYNEWFKAEKGVILGFEKPEKGRIIVVNGEKTLFDSVADENKELYVPEGSFILCSGKAGDVFKANAR